jgi:hypothetical protein
MNYPLTRSILRFVQALGWVLGFLAICISFADIKRFGVGQFVGLAVTVLFAAALNHAMCALGLAFLDLVERYLAKNPWPSPMTERKRMMDDGGPPPPVAIDIRTAAPIPPPVHQPAKKTDLLEDHEPTPAVPTLIVSGELPPSRLLGEGDIARLEAEQRERAKKRQ